MIRILAFLAALFALAPSQAHAQASVVIYCYNGATPNITVPCSAGTPLPVSASVSASIAGFPTIQSTGTPISVTTGGVTGTLPTGAVVVASNVGTTNGAYCKLGASATTSDQFIAPNGGWFAFTVGANTQLTCITSASTTTVNMVGGSGLPTGTGGGSGGGGGGGAITIASSAVASGAYSSGSIASGAYASGAFAVGAGTDGWDVTLGAKADAKSTATDTTAITLMQVSKEISFQAQATAASAATTATNTTGAATSALQSTGNTSLATIATNTTGASTSALQSTGNTSLATIAANTGAAIPDCGATPCTNKVGSLAGQPDPCFATAKTNLPISLQTTSITQQIALSGSTKIYVCSLSLIASAATVFSVTGGTGTNCGTPAALIGTTSASHGLSLAANGGLTYGNGGSTVAVTGAGSELCLVQSGAGDLSGNLTYVQQ